MSCTDATGTGETVTPTAALRDSLVAVTVTTPGAMPVTSPLTSTTAMRESLVVQKTGRPSSGVPASSSVRAVSCTNPPLSRLGVVGVNCTLATARAEIVSCATALRPSTLAAICTLPARNAVTNPAGETRAIVESLLDQNTVRSARGRLFASRAVTCSATLAPSLSVNCSVDNTTETTGVSTGRGAVISPSPLQDVVNAVPSINSRERTTERTNMTSDR